MKIKHFSVILPCTRDVTDFGPSLLKIKENFIASCTANEGVGLSASQVGIEERLFVFLRGNLDWELVCNPKMKPIRDSGLLTENEGCLSVPGESLKIRRWHSVEATWQDETGQVKTEVLTGLEARIFQHEFDHLVARSIRDRFAGQYRSGRYETSRQEKRLREKRKTR